MNTTNRLGRTALHEACTLLDEQLVERLLKAGADPDSGEGDAGTPLSQVMTMSYLPGERAEMRAEVSDDIKRQQKELLDAMRGLQAAVEAMRSPGYTGKHAGASLEMKAFLQTLRDQRLEVPKPEQAMRPCASQSSCSITRPVPTSLAVSNSAPSPPRRMSPMQPG